jgi:hypothetical protein
MMVKMTKIAKNPKMLPGSSDDEANDASGNGTDGAPKPASMFKRRPHGDDDYDPLDLANALTDYEQEDLHLSALADQGDEDAINPWFWHHPDGLTREDVDRQDRALSAVQMGKPRTVFLPSGPVTYLRLTDPLIKDGVSDGVGIGAEHQHRHLLKLEADTPVKLVGPHTEHAIDEIVSALFVRAPAFGTFLQALRDSSHLSLMRGANYFHFRPLLVISSPGMGKSTIVRRLGDAAGLPVIHLDGSTMMTTVDLTGADAVFRTARPGAILKGLIEHKIGNPIVAFDEFDKLADVSHGARENPAEALLPFLEQTTAGRVREHFLQIDLDLRFVNWVLLANDIEKVPRTVRDRCKVIQIPALTPTDLAAMAEAEVRRRHLEPELIAELTRACARGQIKSLRKLNKALDAAEATLRSSTLH